MRIRESYDKFCQEQHVPIFFQPFWLDLSCGIDKWGVAIAEKKGRITGVMPYYLKRKGFISMPHLTPYMGPFIPFPKDMKYAKRLSHEHTVMDELIRQLPRVYYFNQRFYHSLNNWLPFYWNGFSQSTRYTYRLPDISDLDLVYSGFKNNVKRNLKKAEDQFLVRSLEMGELKNFYKIIKANKRANYSFDYMQNMIKSCEQQNCGKTYAAFDQQGTFYAAIFVVWDQQSAYYLIGARDPKLQTQQAMTLNIWRAIQEMSGRTKAFDFEGSMIEPVERYFRTYGAVQNSYFHVQKINNRMLKLAVGMADALNIKYR
ncbi:MAG: GNAT family N-acetyltransferase [Bacteroidota bacterium]